MPSWPASFPPLFETDGASYEPISNATMIEVESGEPLTRLRFTGEMENFTGQLPPCDRAMAIAIRDFWRYDLKEGTLRLLWDDVLTLESREFLVPLIKIVPLGGDNWRVTFPQMQSMPT